MHPYERLFSPVSDAQIKKKGKDILQRHTPTQNEKRKESIKTQSPELLCIEVMESYYRIVQLYEYSACRGLRLLVLLQVVSAAQVCLARCQFCLTRKFIRKG